MKLNVKRLNGENRVVFVDNDFVSLAHLKHDIAEGDDIMILDKNKQMCTDDARALREYGIQDGDTVFVVGKARGGAVSRYTFVFWFFYIGITLAVALFLATGMLTLAGEVYGIVFGDMLNAVMSKLAWAFGVNEAYFSNEPPTEQLKFWSKVGYFVFYLIRIVLNIFNYVLKHGIVVVFLYVLFVTYFYPLILSIAQSSYYDVGNDMCYTLEHSKSAARILTIIFAVIYGSYQSFNIVREIGLASLDILFSFIGIIVAKDKVDAWRDGMETTATGLSDAFNKVKYVPLIGVLSIIGIGEAIESFHGILDTVGSKVYDGVVKELEYTDFERGNMLVVLTMYVVRYFLFRIPFIGNIFKYTFYTIDGLSRGMHRLYNYTDSRDNSWRLLNDIIKSGNIAGLITAICFLIAVPVIIILTYFRHAIAEAMPEIENIEGYVEWILRMIWKIFFSWWL